MFLREPQLPKNNRKNNRGKTTTVDNRGQPSYCSHRRLNRQSYMPAFLFRRSRRYAVGREDLYRNFTVHFCTRLFYGLMISCETDGHETTVVLICFTWVE